MMIVNAGITRVVSREFYPDQRFWSLVGHSISWEMMEAK
jgi:deoxycytidylate deaminase